MNCFVTEGGWGGKNHVLAWQSDPIHPIWTKIGVGMIFDHGNKPTEDFFIFLKIQDGGLRSKVKKIDQI